jgi:hypothetical protein
MERALVHDVLVVVATVALCWMIERCIRWWLRREDEERIRQALQTLAHHGMDAFFYMPGVDAEDEELRRALYLMEHTGRIVLDRDGNVVGRLMPKVAKGPHLRLVVNNT